MDPLSVTGTVVGLTFQCAKLIVQVKDAFGKYKDAPLALTALEDECQVVGAVLSHLSSVLGSQIGVSFHLTSESPLHTIFLHAVKGSEALLLCIDTEFKSLMGRADWRAKVTTLWKEQTMTDLVQKLGRRKSDIILLIACLNMPSVTDRNAHLKRSGSQLETSRQDLVDLVSSYPRAHSSIIEALDSDTIECLLSDRDSVMSKTRFDFDSLLLETKPYRSMKRRRLPKRAEDLGRIEVETGPVEETIVENMPEEEEDLIDLSSALDLPIRTYQVSEDLAGLVFGEAGQPADESRHHPALWEACYDRPAHPTEVDRTQSEDIIALMDHVSVQRSAQDKHMLQTLVRSAAEMRTSFEEIKAMVAKAEETLLDVPGQAPPGSHLDSLGASSAIMRGRVPRPTEDQDFAELPARKRNLFRRALKGLVSSGNRNNNLRNIEDMLNDLLGQADKSKYEKTPSPRGMENGQAYEVLKLVMPGETRDIDEWIPNTATNQPTGFAAAGLSYESRRSRLSFVREDDETEARGSFQGPVDETLWATDGQENSPGFESNRVASGKNHVPSPDGGHEGTRRRHRTPNSHAVVMSLGAAAAASTQSHTPRTVKERDRTRGRRLTDEPLPGTGVKPEDTLVPAATSRRRRELSDPQAREPSPFSGATRQISPVAVRHSARNLGAETLRLTEPELAAWVSTTPSIRKSESEEPAKPGNTTDMTASAIANSLVSNSEAVTSATEPGADTGQPVITSNRRHKRRHKDREERVSSITPKRSFSPTSGVSANNPKVLELVEEAIRRLTLPEMEAVKRDAARRKKQLNNGTDGDAWPTEAVFAEDGLKRKLRKRESRFQVQEVPGVGDLNAGQSVTGGDKRFKRKPKNRGSTSQVQESPGGWGLDAPQNAAEADSRIPIPTEEEDDTQEAETASYKIPDDGSPVTVKTRKAPGNHSQTSLLIEYFEGGKETGDPNGPKKPSVRVRVTPSRKSYASSHNDHIMITEPKVGRIVTSDHET